MRGIRLITTLAAAALLLAGCGKPGMAAKVGDREFSQNDVAIAADELPAVTGQAVSGPDVVAAMLVSSAMRTAAGEHGVHVNVQEVRSELTKLGIESDDLSDVTLQLLSGQMLQQRAAQLGAEEVEAISQRTDEIVTKAEVNPRYFIDAKHMRPAEAPSWLELPTVENPQ